MGSLAHVVPWIPEDDLLLKNAIEAGASLQALAKGAVQFSTRFSIRELQDRWHSLLYDPVVSSQAAFRMTEIELTNPNFPTKFPINGYSKGNKRKRKAENLKSAYHRSLKKKFSAETLNSLEQGFLENGDATQFGLEDSDFDIIHSAFPGLLSVVPEDSLHRDIGGGEEDLTFTEHAGPLECDLAHEMKPTMASNGFFEEMSTSLLGDFETFMEVSDNKEVDKSYDDRFSSLLAELTNATNSREDVPNYTEQSPLIPQTHTPIDAFLDDDHVMMPKIVATSALDPHPEIVGGVICCLLNREDHYVPCNDFIFLSSNKCLPRSVSSLARRKYPMKSSRGKPEISQQGQRIKFRPLTCPESRSNVGLGGSTGSAKPSSTMVSDKEMIGGQKFVGFDGHGSYLEKDSETNKEEKSVLHEDDDDDDDDDGLRETLREPEGNAFESDEDLPNYSDVEAMILDMDLDPDDQDNFDLEVSKYQSQDMKRTIVRLEQSASSYMQRAIASRGAFAVLYGRYSKHYIKKPEVLVGRSTEDLKVDIDLGREKRGSKISRRQAIIRLGNEGLFHIKNLGKYSISVNDKEVDHGESLILKSDSLIEIRGMPFVFETNQSCIKEYLKRTEEKMS